MNTLAMSTPTRQATLCLDIPLHKHTDSENDVAQLVERLLNEIAGFAHRASHADVMQALAITTEVRAAMANAAAKTGVNVCLKLLDVEVGSGHDAGTCVS